jgi:hypothetical protein
MGKNKTEFLSTIMRQLDIKLIGFVSLIDHMQNTVFQARSNAHSAHSNEQRLMDKNCGVNSSLARLTYLDTTQMRSNSL